MASLRKRSRYLALTDPPAKPGWWESSPTPPLATLPMPVLLRSLLISTVCAKPYFLTPSLSILSFLAKPGRSFLFSIEKNPLLYWLVKRTLYDQFCIGETAAEATRNMKKMHEFGISGIILTYAKETTFDHKSKTVHTPGFDAQQGDTVEKCEDIEAWRVGTLQTVHMAGDGDQVAIKMTGAGPVATKAFAAGNLPPKQMMDTLDEICVAASQIKSRIVIDAESQHFQKGIARTSVALMRKHNTEQHPLVYHTYQCYLKGTRQRVAKDLALAAQEGWTVGVKLVRGAYMSTDERSKIHNTKEETDEAYDSITRDLLRRDSNGFDGLKQWPRMSVLLATHNKNTLHGMADSLSFTLLNAKSAGGETPKVLKCSTWGSLGECMAYLLRRAVENRQAVSRTQDEFKAVKAEFSRLIRAEGK
ncbi:proline oxidase [Xylaria digitata]|nr:proline oxidase [Xylaria digitata]